MSLSDASSEYSISDETGVRNCIYKFIFKHKMATHNEGFELSFFTRQLMEIGAIFPNLRKISSAAPWYDFDEPSL